MLILAKHVGVLSRVVFLGIAISAQSFPLSAALLDIPGNIIPDPVTETTESVKAKATAELVKEVNQHKSVTKNAEDKDAGKNKEADRKADIKASNNADDDSQTVKIIVADEQTYDYDIESMSADQAYKKGRLLRAQFKNSDARAYLRYAADKKHADAAFLYAVELMKYNATVRTPAESRKYIELSAKLGNLHAMRYLYKRGDWLRPKDRNTWKKRYHDGLIAFAGQNPGEATYLLSLFFQNRFPDKSDYYLRRSVKYNYPLALMEKARRQQGSGTPQLKFSTDGSRDPDVLRTYKQAASEGFIPAIKACVELYEARDDFQEAFKWRLKAVEAGDLTSLFAVAKIYSHEAASYQFVDKDLIKARAFSELYLDFAGDDRFTKLHQMVEQFFVDVTEQLTPPEVIEANAFVTDYKEKTLFYNHDIYWDL
ncbi:hypothetical protein VA7868_00542 [Vibrio aerogenes CECT 7868]|uniref:Sel1 repeat protein n=1 Tax=Vibrio aerogenes CECT 7868 TaxID=1216006 RepID=A0A1M5VX46_9VIBR|nr:hypothetical protein [Vibrio aerogenes]SHH79806.1 hypothetical protein VA7868_00542 [Vibrio aerogenes CECT 7868]